MLSTNVQHADSRSKLFFFIIQTYNICIYIEYMYLYEYQIMTNILVARLAAIKHTKKIRVMLLPQ